MTERGYVVPGSERTVDIPAGSAAAAALLEIDGIDPRDIVAIGLHFTKGIKLRLCATSGSAVLGFLGESHARLLSQASPIEWPVVGDRTEQGSVSLFIERIAGAAETNGISFWLIKGTEQ